MIHAVLRAVLVTGGAKRGQVPKPLQIPRPEIERPKRLPTQDEVVAFFAAFTPQGG